MVPVSDVDRAKAFSVDKVGFHADHDHTPTADIRFVQLTPPGPACSIAIGRGITPAKPSSVEGLQMVVSDIEVAHAELERRGATSAISTTSTGVSSSSSATPTATNGPSRRSPSGGCRSTPDGLTSARRSPARG